MTISPTPASNLPTHAHSKIEWCWLGQVPFGEALVNQREYRESILRDHAPDMLWLLEHPDVVTVGRRPVPGLPSRHTLAQAGIGFVTTERGGLATWHGPGQLIVYVLVDVVSRALGVKSTIQALEQGIINWLNIHEIQAHRSDLGRGIWVGDNKIGSIGMHFRKGVSMHGLSLNLTSDLSRFQFITPCGIKNGGVTSVLNERGDSPTPAQAASSVASHLIQALTVG